MQFYSTPTFRRADLDQAPACHGSHGSREADGQAFDLSTTDQFASSAMTFHAFASGPVVSSFNISRCHILPVCSVHRFYNDFETQRAGKDGTLSTIDDIDIPGMSHIYNVVPTISNRSCV